MPGSGITGLNGAYIFNFHMLGELSSIKNVNKLSSIDNTNLHFHQQLVSVIMQTFENSAPFTFVLSTKPSKLGIQSCLTSWRS